LSKKSPQVEAPRIEPVSSGAPRPVWSVMIPTFNCAKCLGQTLESVLSQDPGADQMQIEVVDDCSTKDDPAAVVQEIGRGRVIFHRKEKNEGATANFNSCLQRSRGHLIHILHGDDWVLPGFYARIQEVADRYHDCALFATRSFYTDEEGHYTGLTHRLPSLEKSPGRNARGFYGGTPVQFAGVVVRRCFYEAEGGFNTSLVHTADWEMWARAVAKGGGLVLPEVLAAYRVFAGNDTGSLMRRAENLRDRERLHAILSDRHEDFNVAAAKARLLKMAMDQERRFEKSGDDEAAAANREFWLSRAPLDFRVRAGIGQLRRKIGV
jgi:glycosyltransferase involved in cell wall biosynthesis